MRSECIHCGSPLVLGENWKDYQFAASDYRCRKCKRKAQQEWYTKAKATPYYLAFERLRQTLRRTLNREAHNAYHREYSERNREARRAYDRAYYQRVKARKQQISTTQPTTLP